MVLRTPSSPTTSTLKPACRCRGRTLYVAIRRVRIEHVAVPVLADHELLPQSLPSSSGNVPILPTRPCIATINDGARSAQLDAQTPPRVQHSRARSEPAV